MVEPYCSEPTSLGLGATVGILIVPTRRYKDHELGLKAMREIKALVDAAPDLLAALEGMISGWDGYHENELRRRIQLGGMDQATLNRVLIAREAIAKATAP